VRLNQATVVVILGAAVLSGCTQAGQNAAGGAAAGGIIGAATGGIVGRSPTGVLIGAGVGATAGAIIAANNTRPRRILHLPGSAQRTTVLCALPMTDRRVGRLEFPMG
jgi:hypothetical protein